MPKNKPRRLWLQIKYKTPGSNKVDVVHHLLHLLRRGSYDYRDKHPTWRIAIGWSNKEGGQLKWGEYEREMQQSRQSSPGWDIAVTDYLESQL
jgi:hypothetical protein